MRLTGTPKMLNDVQSNNAYPASRRQLNCQC